MMRLFWSTILLLSSISSSASAWEISVDEDPIDDRKTAYIAAVDTSAGVMGAVTLGVKCWEGTPESTALIIATMETWDATASYNGGNTGVFSLTSAPKMFMFCLVNRVQPKGGV